MPATIVAHLLRTCAGTQCLTTAPVSTPIKSILSSAGVPERPTLPAQPPTILTKDEGWPPSSGSTSDSPIDLAGGEDDAS